MGIKKYHASKDNTITNAYKNDLLTTGTGSNMGAADILEAFVIQGQTSASISAANAEQSRIIIQFPVNSIQSDISSGVLPANSGSIKFHLNLYNAPHGNTTPENFTLDLLMLSQSWAEGRGLDMDNYSDIGVSNWVNCAAGTVWTSEGGSYITGINTSASLGFDTGLENISVDVSEQVYKWLGSVDNNGFLIKFTDAEVSGSDSLYTKMFFGRTSEFFFYQPTIEARWDSTRKDNRGSFFISSSLAPSEDNLNTLYLYNRVRGQLVNIPNLSNDKVMVEIFSGSSAPTGSALNIIDSSGQSVTSVTGGLLVENGNVVVGVYTASFASTSSLDTVYDVWHTGSGGSRIEFYTGSYEPKSIETSDLIYNTTYLTTITNLEDSYTRGQKPHLRVFVRDKNWSPNIYTVANSKIETTIIEDAYYKVFRSIDNLEIVPFGTGSSNNNFTRLSYDLSGNYFELDTSYLEAGYSYGIQFAYYLQGEYHQQPEVFKFKIEEEDV
tara:strand:- start:8040 stop:9527 length:1488 start_codon:yes stop_codon:yes gene_type:complete